jgi:hypothetical protein
MDGRLAGYLGVVGLAGLEVAVRSAGHCFARFSSKRCLVLGSGQPLLTR